jgi:hypothetical protein
MHSSGLATPTCTCSPAQNCLRADGPAYSTKLRYPSFGVIACSSETAAGQVPTAASVRPASRARARASLRRVASSAAASATIGQTLVFSSSMAAKSSGFRRTPSSIAGGTARGSSVSASRTKSSSSSPIDHRLEYPKACGITGRSLELLSSGALE